MDSKHFIDFLSLYYPENKLKQMMEVPCDEFTRGLSFGVLIGALVLNPHMIGHKQKIGRKS